MSSAIAAPTRFSHPLATRVVDVVPGLALAAIVAAASSALGALPWLAAHGVGALTLAIVLGIAIGNTVYPRVAARSTAGVTFAKQTLLRLGIVLYGLRLTFQDIGHVGVAGIVIDTLVLSSTFGLACLLGTRVFGLDRRTAMLIGAGSSICGAAAVMAAEPVVRGRSEQVTVAVATVVVFGTLAIFLYPALYHAVAEAHLFAWSPKAYGLFAGSTIHEVAQVVAAGRAVSPAASDAAVIAKMVRVTMLAPFLVALSSWIARHPAGDTGRDVDGAADGTARSPTPITIPWFALVFVAVAGFNSFHLLPQAVVVQLTGFDTFVLAMAMAALGLTTHASALKTAGVRPLALAAVLFGWLVAGGLAINLAVTAWLG